jgi:membrane fusion protein (multidrug efflux system)
MASPDRALMAIVPLDDVWVVANFKETQLEDMRTGQPVDIAVDAFGGKKLHGHVESFASGTGSKFSLLPPDNSSGNFVKVVQRVPTLVRLDDPSAKLELRPGMSVSVDVTTK